MTAIKFDDTHVENIGDPLGEVWWQGRQWAVTSDGIERRDGTYVIEKHRLREDFKDDSSWISHMGGKIWIDLDDFTAAYFVACAMHCVRLSKTEVDMLIRHVEEEKAEQVRSEKMKPYLRKAEAMLGLNTATREHLLVSNWIRVDKLAEELAKADGVI